MDALSSSSTFNHERVPMSCLQQQDTLQANNWTNSNIQQSNQRLWSQFLTAHICHYVSILKLVVHAALATFIAKLSCSNLWWSITRSFLLQICIALKEYASQTPWLHSLVPRPKLAPGWAVIQANFDPIQEIGPKVWGGHSFNGGHSFEGGRSFAILW